MNKVWKKLDNSNIATRWRSQSLELIFHLERPTKLQVPTFKNLPANYFSKANGNISSILGDSKGRGWVRQNLIEPGWPLLQVYVTIPSNNTYCLCRYTYAHFVCMEGCGCVCVHVCMCVCMCRPDKFEHHSSEASYLVCGWCVCAPNVCM